MFCASVPGFLEQEFNSNLRPQNHNIWFKDEGFPSAKAAATSQSVFPLEGLGKMTLCRVDNSGCGTAGKHKVKECSPRGNLEKTYKLYVSFLFSLAVLPRPRVDAVLQYWKYSKAICTLCWATCPWGPCLSQEFGQDNLQRSLPTSTVLWVCDHY